MATNFPTSVETRADVPALGAAGEVDRDRAVNQWAIDAILALQAAIGASGGLGTMLEGAPYVDTQLTAAQINALMATNVEVLPAPAAGIARFPLAIYLFLEHGGTDFVQTNVTDHLALKYNGGAEIVEITTEARLTNLLHASADAALFYTFAYSSPAIPTNVLAATAIDLDNNGAAEYSTGDGTLSVRIWYRDVPFAAFT
jgi:hypothetical protein